MYTQKVMEAFQNPKNVGEIQDYDGMGMIGSEACGDIMQVFIKVKDNVIADAKFKTFGCAAAIATSSTATEMIKGMTVDEALEVTNKKGHRSSGRPASAENTLFGACRTGDQGGDRGL